MSYGKMTVPIILYRIHYTKDKDGFTTAQEEPVASVRAYFEPRNTTEKWTNRVVLKEASALFRFRHVPNLRIDTSMVIGCLGERYNIVSVENVRQKNMYYEVIGRLEDTHGKDESKNA